jgi:hypothetical protein
VEQEEVPPSRRLVGIDLGIASRHSVRVLEADGQLVCRSGCVPTVESLTLTEQAALAGAPVGTRLAVVSGPTGPAWLPVAVFFARRGHDVYRVSLAKAADLRRFLRRHAKSNGIDAETLARMPLADPGGLQKLELPGADAAALDRRVRACDRLTRAASEHKVRIKDLVRQLMPMTALTGDIGKADLAVLERCADPRALLAAGPAELIRLITSASGCQQGKERAWPSRRPPSTCMRTTRRCRSLNWLPRSRPRCGCCGRSRPSWPATPRPASSTTGRSNPAQLARSLPGIAEISAPVLVAIMGRPAASATRPGSNPVGATDRSSSSQARFPLQGSRALIICHRFAIKFSRYWSVLAVVVGSSWHGSARDSPSSAACVRVR